MENTAAKWNDAHAVGTDVVYTPIKGRDEHQNTVTRSEAWELGHGAVVVLVEGVAGGVSIEHLTVGHE